MAGRGLRISVERLSELGADLSRFEDRLPTAIYYALKGEGGEALESNMKSKSPHKSGGLVAGIGIHSMGSSVMVGYLGGISNTVTSNSRNQLGAWIESGTKPHTIRAKDGGSLMIGGRFVEEVHHPGSGAQKIAQKSIRAAKWEVEAAIVDELDKIPGGITT